MVSAVSVPALFAPLMCVPSMVAPRRWTARAPWRSGPSRGSAAARGPRPTQVKTLAPLLTIAPEGLSAIADEEWEEFELAVDSGASETVVGEEMIQSADITGRLDGGLIVISYSN